MDTAKMDVTMGDRLLQSLNCAQKDAVTTAAEHLLVLAGAGSGKTRVLVHRVAWLLAQRLLSPYQILVVTFTNKAAAEVRGRIFDLSENVQGIWVGTFHSITHRLLRMHWQEAGLPENFQILDADDQQRLIKRVIKGLGYDEKRWPAKQAQWFINQSKDEGLRARHIDTRGDPTKEVLKKIYTTYEAQCQQSGLVDFAELLLRVHDLWRTRQDLLQHYQRRFRHVLVDEFQDTNAIQYAWLRLLVGDGCQLTVVGDDDQSIYGWRGAKVEHIQQFTQDYPKHTLVRLEQNYRSTGVILSAANAVIAHNGSRLGKELWTECEDGELIKLYRAFHEVDEARFIANQIKHLVAENAIEYDQIAILYRSNAQSRAIEEVLVGARIPYYIYGGLRFFERAEIRNALAYLRLLLSPDDDAAFERVVNMPPRGIGERTLADLRDTARSHSYSLWQAAQHLATGEQLSGRRSRSLQAFVDLITTMRQQVQSLSLVDQTQKVIEMSGLLRHYQQDKSLKSMARVENLQELVTATRQFCAVDHSDALDHVESEPWASLALFLDEVVLDVGSHAVAEEATSAVQLMTLHAAKGLEFEVVFLAGMEEGLFPHQMTYGQAEKIEEERRLCYVGMTRAMRWLYITYCETRRIFGDEKRHRLSRFIHEIPDHLLTDIQIKSAHTVYGNSMNRVYGSSNLKQNSLLPSNQNMIQEDNTLFPLGQRVSHKVFGDGVVLQCEGRGDRLRVHVAFDREGEKWLMAKLANLSPVC